MNLFVISVLSSFICSIFPYSLFPLFWKLYLSLAIKFTFLSSVHYVAEKAVFWPAFNCFILILDSCGSRLWPILTRSPQQVFDIIVNHQVYIRDMKQYSLKSSGTTSDQVFNSSQDCQVSSQVLWLCFWIRS